MRHRLLLLLTAACLSACDQRGEDAAPVAPVQQAALSFDGANYQDEAGKLAHGKRLVRVLGCQGCHGADLTGKNVTEDEPDFGDMNAPNLTLLMAGYSDAELERAIRQGIPKDGREMWFMPSETYQFLSDADLNAVIAHLRTLKPTGKPLPPIRIGPGLRQQAKDGIFINATGMVKRFRDRPPIELGDQHALGRHVAKVVCAECHNNELQGFPKFTPDLDIAGAYSPAELETLLTTGKGKTRPDLGLMTLSAGRFKELTPRERQAVISYLKARADRST